MVKISGSYLQPFLYDPYPSETGAGTDGRAIAYTKCYTACAIHRSSEGHSPGHFPLYYNFNALEKPYAGIGLQQQVNLFVVNSKNSSNAISLIETVFNSRTQQKSCASAQNTARSEGSVSNHWLLGGERQSACMSKITNDGLTQSFTVPSAVSPPDNECIWIERDARQPVPEKALFLQVIARKFVH